MNATSSFTESVVLHLLDGVRGHPLHTWTLQQPVILIGRSAGCDVVVPDPHVSRQHAELQLRGDTWVLRSLSQFGLVIDGRLVDGEAIVGSTLFRLGTGGPELQFQTASALCQEVTMSTMAFPFAVHTPVAIDHEAKTREVAEAAGRAGIDGLLEKARRLRKGRDG